MKRKVKRKYTRKPKQDALQSQIKPVKEESGVILPPVFSFADLPPSLQMQVEGIIQQRKRFGLPDDSKERKSLAVRMFKGGNPR